MNIVQIKKYFLLIKVERIEQAKFTYHSLGNALEKQTKMTEDQGKK